MYKIITKSSASWSRIGYTLLALLLASAAAYFTPSFSSRVWDKAPGMVCNAYSILTGFFLAILTMSGTFDSALSTLSSADLKKYRNTFARRLERQAVGCFCCLISVIFSIVVELNNFNFLEIWLRRIFTFMTVISLFWALSLPYTIYIFYNDRYEYMLKHRKSTEITINE